jgi:ABC-type spermidine/putrescine transport system permease subunit II
MKGFCHVYQTASTLAATLNRDLKFAAMTLGAQPSTVLMRVVLHKTLLA